MIAREELKIGCEIPVLTKVARMETRWPKETQRRGDTPNIHDDDFAQSIGYDRGFVLARTCEAYVSQMMNQAFGEGWVQGGKLALTFIRPVYHGEQIVVHGLVRETSQNDGALRVTLDVWIDNEKGEKVVAGTTSARLR